MIVAGIALAGALVGGHWRLRWSWADAGLIALGLLVSLSVGHAADRRAALNLGWEWRGFVIAYLLVRNLPRTRGESSALVAALAATAVSVAVYGLFQAGVEIPELQHRFLQNKDAMIVAAGYTPGTAAAVSFEHRLLHSNEIFSTFSLANSLAGFIVGPLVVMLALLWDGLTRRDENGRRAGVLALLLAAAPTTAVLICLVLTKSRSAWIGLAGALLVLAWRERRRVPARVLALGAAGVLVVVVGLAYAGMKTGRLDPQVLTESNKSFRYRREYWVGTWRAVNESSWAFWHGFGPGNFSAAYLRHKLPEASEEIKDPHNFALETWATGGIGAVAALAVALGFGFWGAFGPSRAGNHDPKPPPDPLEDASPPPASARWLMAAAALGWLVVLLVGDMDLIGAGLFERWMILGAAWALAVACGGPLWVRHPIASATLGAAALAVLINLSAAGGIGIPTVALALWVSLALALNLRNDRPEARRRTVAGGRLSAFVVAAVWVALVGTYYGQVAPYLRCQAALEAAEAAMKAKPPDLERAEAYYERAKAADELSARPWFDLAMLDYAVWNARGAKSDDLRWRKIPIEMFKAVERPRPTDNWSRHLERAQMTTLLLSRLASSLKPLNLAEYRANVIEATRKASLLYPTNASLRARLAEASAELGMTADALKEGRSALDLDARTPHADKKLDPAIRLVWLRMKSYAHPGSAPSRRPRAWRSPRKSPPRPRSEPG